MTSLVAYECDNESGSGGVGSTNRSLTPQLDLGERGLGVKPTHSVCQFPDCGRPHRSHGLCNGHYAQQRRGAPLAPLRTESRRLIDLTGQRFGLLMVVMRADSNASNNESRWLCRCDCGGETTTQGASLRRGRTTSCGCAVATRNRALRTTHGLSHSRSKQGHPLYSIWSGMRDRCNNPKNGAYQNYGGRGISIAPQWDDFPTFVRDVGPRPTLAHSIDRIDNDGNYEPGNVRWATSQQQANNRRRSRHV